MIGSAGIAIGVSQKRAAQVFRFPAPVGGIDIRKSIGSEDLNNCVYTYNLLPYEYGMRVRNGFQEWQVDIVDSLVDAAGVHTLIPYDADTEGGVNDRLFSVTNEGIWDTTDYAAAPILKVVFPINSAEAGYGTYAHYTGDDGVNILFYADKVNGLYEYDPTGGGGAGAWKAVPFDAATGIAGVDPANIKFVVTHKQRIWFAETSTTDAWYLEVGAKKGTATVFHMGSKFRHGGSLEGIFNWSVDGGEGLDDLLVFVSHAGDVVVYKGDDPTSENWTAIGTYYIGEIPNTPRFGSEQGGELHLLSAFGVSSMNDILKGVDSNVLQADVDGTTIAAKVGGLIRERMKLTSHLDGWGIAFTPSEGGLIISTPTVGANDPVQYYYNFTTGSWGLWRGVPMTCFSEYDGAVVFGSRDSKIYRMDVPVDNAVINPPAEIFNGTDIEFSILTSFNSLGSPAQFKRPKLIRPDFISTLEPVHASVCRYDFDVTEGVNSQIADPATHAIAFWGENGVGDSLWDATVWGSSIGQTFPTIGGVWGHGRYIAIATKGKSRTATRLVGWDLIYDVGGPLI